MRKNIRVPLGAGDVGRILQSVRSRTDSMLAILKSAKILLSPSPIAPADAHEALVLVVSRKMNRLFFVTEKKISSLSFPFNAEQLPGGSVRLRSQSGIEIDSLNSSQVIALLSESSLARNPSHTALAEALIDAHSDSDAPSILVELLLWEEGYIRYDWDTGRADAALHPEHHIDVFHSSPSSFKIGLDNRIRVEELIDIMEIESSCRYLR